MPSTTDIHGGCAKWGPVQNQQAKLKGKICIPCAHFIEHIEGIVHGSVYAGNGEHTGECSLLHRFSGLFLQLGREVEQDAAAGVVGTDGDGAQGRRA